MRADTAIYVAHDDFVKRDSAEPERNLMRAILRSAMEDMRKRGEAYRDARRYFMSNEDFYVYSFLSICYHLDLCPRTIRTVLGLLPGDRETMIIMEEGEAREFAERAGGEEPDEVPMDVLHAVSSDAHVLFVEGSAAMQHPDSDDAANDDSSDAEERLTGTV